MNQEGICPPETFLTISEAAAVAQPGDTVLVAPGTYRERVDPPRGGVTYRSETPSTAIVTGAEPLTGWVCIGEGLYQARVHNAVFGGDNPFVDPLAGHMGGIFSRIEDNHIHHINLSQELLGAEIGGIKLHAAIDTEIARNHIHHCTRGIWLDWQSQGTRIPRAKRPTMCPTARRWRAS